MAKFFKDYIGATGEKHKAEDAKKAAADAAQMDYAGARADTHGAEGDELKALQYLGGKTSVANGDGTITNYYLDSRSPNGYSSETVPDGATAEIPDDFGAGGTTGGTGTTGTDTGTTTGADTGTTPAGSTTTGTGTTPATAPDSGPVVSPAPAPAPAATAGSPLDAALSSDRP